MRICLVGTGVQPIPPPGYGGVERTIAEFAGALRQADHDVRIINEVRAGRGRDEYAFALHLPKLLGSEPFDVIHASTPVVANRLAWARIPFVYTTHSRHWFIRSGWNERWGAWLERRAVRRAAATVALTERLSRQIAAETAPHGPRRLAVIPIGVDAHRFQPDWPRRTGRRALGVGIVRPFKRWDLAAQALRGTGISLTIVGPTPDASYARTVQGSGDSVSLLGEVEDARLAQLFAESDLLVHPSEVELLAGVVIQALAAGLPVIGAEPVAGLLDEGRTGFASPVGADRGAIVSAFHDSAVRLTADDALRRRMGEAARVAALERFSWTRVVRDHAALYESLAAQGQLNRRRGPSR
ncbi:MAG: glycosyltransferase family 4 protein [Thermoplasmata archaeon]|nr:glycosyltransferase family 4 protein [Thermoplasmata archaeon]